MHGTSVIQLCIGSRPLTNKKENECIGNKLSRAENGLGPSDISKTKMGGQ